MTTRTGELVAEWDSVPFDGGYDGLRSLSDQGFSGAVTAGPAQLFMLNGTVVGVVDGDVESFEDASGTARAAPHDALPLLTVMQDSAGEARAQYYTEETSISEVDRTLSDGNFTGYVELSENVLSGDYYLVYHQGRSMSVAWVGSSNRLVTDEEAFEQADGEVGIYDVIPAEIDPIELPGPPEPEPADESTAATATEEPAEAESGGADPPGADTPAVEETAQAAADDADGGSSVTEPAASEPDGTDGPERPGPPESKADGASRGVAVDRRGDEEPNDRAETDQRQQSDATEQSTETSDTAETQARQEEGVETADPAPERTTEQSPAATELSETASSSAEADETPSTDPDSASMDGTAADDESVALETQTVPSLDPDLSSTASESTAEPAETPAEQSTPQPGEPPRQQRAAIAELETQVDEREERIAELETQVDEVTAENEELAAERDRLVTELEETRAEIRRLKEQLEAADTPATGGHQLSAAEAIDGTNLFVRYHSKGEATLSSAQEGSADRAAVEENLRLEYHTQFEASDAVVDGQSFAAFLQESIHYRFVGWLVRGLLYEIRDTGHESEMGVVYEALSSIDRAELNGKVSVTYTEDGQEHRSQETFDVAVRDRMGNPLIVANINDSREPATDGQMTDLLRAAERVGDSSDSLSAAFLVTSSFFEPDALETATEATASGLFSRDKRKSFVNLSRKGGYHLCLLEARNREFHLAVPEL